MFNFSGKFWVLFYSVNVELYKVLVKELAETLERQFSGNAESQAAGMVINTMGWIEGVGYEVTRLSGFYKHTDYAVLLLNIRDLFFNAPFWFMPYCR